MRLFNRVIFDEFIDGTASRYSSSDLNLLLGSAEKLVLQARASKVGGTSPTITVVVEHSNDGRDWKTANTVFNVGALLGNQFNIFIGDTSTTVFAGLVRLNVSLGGTTPSASVQITACGRAEQGGQ